MGLGVKPGYRQVWKYRERESKNYGSKLTIRQLKTRIDKKIKHSGSFKPGSHIDWQWQGQGKTVKVKPGLYKEIIRYTKRPRGIKIRGHKKWLSLGRRR